MFENFAVIKMPKDVFNEGDSRYAVVEWPGENKFNPIPMSDFVKLVSDEDYKDGEIYKVRFFGKKYSAKLIQKGTVEECESRVASITNYILEQNKKKNTTRPNNKQIEKEVEKENDSLALELKDMEISKLKEKLEKTTELLDLEQKKVLDLNIEVEVLKQELEKEKMLIGN